MRRRLLKLLRLIHRSEDQVAIAFLLTHRSMKMLDGQPPLSAAVFHPFCPNRKKTAKRTDFFQVLFLVKGERLQSLLSKVALGEDCEAPALMWMLLAVSC